MGNTNSTNTNNPLNKTGNFYEIIDYIASHYILTMDFESLKKLSQKEYCNKLVIITADIIKDHFTERDITYLAQRVSKGVEVNKMSNQHEIFVNEDKLKDLDTSNGVIDKKRKCIGIAKFYIKIAHIFAAIVTTINPVYVYKDKEGNTIRASLNEKGKIPANTPRDIYKLNICDNRINSLQNKQSLEPDANGDILVGPKICNINIGDNGLNKSLNDEPGIPELMELYYDDNYDYKTGKFTGMSENTKKIFQADLKIFYNIFTGNNDMPSDITKFSDIKLRDYHRMEKCQGKEPLFNKKVKGPLTNKLFNNYAENLKKMIQTTNQNQEALLTIINQLFVYTIDPQTNKKQIRVNPSLTEEQLNKIVVETRSLIIKLYLSCEIDYVNGLKIYEAIVEQKILETAQNQIQNLEKLSNEIIIEENIPVPVPAEVQEMKENK